MSGLKYHGQFAIRRSLDDALLRDNSHAVSHNFRGKALVVYLCNIDTFTLDRCVHRRVCLFLKKSKHGFLSFLSVSFEF